MQFILMGLHRIVENNALLGKISSSTLNHLLERLLQNPNTKPIKFSTMMVILKKLSQDAHIMGLIETPIIDDSIVRFLIQSDIDTRSFGFVFNALGYFAESNQLTSPPNGHIIDNLFYKLGTLPMDGAMEISSCFHVMRIFIEKGVDSNGFGNYINDLMQMMLTKEELIASLVTPVFSSIGVMAKRKMLLADIDANILNLYLRLFNHRFINNEIKYVDMILLTLKILIHTKKLQGDLDAQALFPLINRLIESRKERDARLQKCKELMMVATQVTLINLEGVNIQAIIECVRTTPLISLKNDFLLQFLEVCALVARANPEMVWDKDFIKSCMSKIETHQPIERHLKTQLVQMIRHNNVPNIIAPPIQTAFSRDDEQIVIEAPTPRQSIYSDEALKQKVFRLIATKNFNELENCWGLKHRRPVQERVQRIITAFLMDKHAMLSVCHVCLIWLCKPSKKLLKPWFVNFLPRLIELH